MAFATRVAVLVVAGMLAASAALAQGMQSVRHALTGAGAVETRGTGGAGADTTFAVASVGKAFTAVAVLRLADRGLLDLDAPAAAFVPPASAAAYGGMRGITLRHLLTMTSGLPDYYDDAYFEDALADPAGVQTALVALDHGAGAPIFAPGRDFDYSNTNYLILGLALEQATGRPLGAVLEAEVFGPAGMQDSFLSGTRPLPPDFAKGHPERAGLRGYYAGEGFGDGSVLSTAADLVRFYRALFRDGALLPPPMLDLLQQDPVGQGYGMGLEIEGRIVGHSGGDYGYASDVRMNLGSGTIAVVLVADEDGDTGWAWDRVAR